MSYHNINITGLSQQEVLASRKKHGDNQLRFKQTNVVVEAVKGLAKEPMIILLLVAAAIYFIMGETGDGLFLVFAIFLVAFISLYQDSRSRNALENLKSLTQPKCKVIRDGQVQEITSEELVLGDSLVIEEGASVTADGTIVHSNDFSLNESILTGESLAVFKSSGTENKSVYAGTSVASGLAVAVVTQIGNDTRLGKIGKSLEAIPEEKTPLEIQISNFVKKMVIAGATVFVIIWVINFFQSRDLLDSLLKALTLAMSILPEEIPVALTTFMALGAWRLMKLGIVVKQMKTVETLGSATVICTDKTGTITENRMSLAKMYLFKSNLTAAANAVPDGETITLVTTAMWASEPIPFDPMEVALHQHYKQLTPTDERPVFKMIHEYPLGGKPPMMTHVFEKEGGPRIIAAKGAPEAMMSVAHLSPAEKQQVTKAVSDFAESGYRVLGVGSAQWSDAVFPAQQQQLSFAFLGLLAFYDPPKKNIQKTFEDFYAAGIQVKIVTGDNAATTSAIAKQVGFAGADKSLTGDELMQLSDEALQQRVMDTNIFTRMFPEAKLRIINALKQQQQVVAMTGDGVNDGPALKAAHIGIAMGRKGTEIAKQAASLVLVEDDLSKMVEAIAMGRKIYANLKKAIQYIISIHIPIILTVVIPLLLGWQYPAIFSPAHVIFLELIMGPTCSIIYENEPMEKNAMLQNPRPFTSTFFNGRELTTSILQGLAITVGTLSVYQYSTGQGYNENLTRAMVFATLIFANIFLTLVNRSFFDAMLTTLRYKNNLVLYIILITILLLLALLYLPFASSFFDLEALHLSQLLVCAGIGCASVIWYEIVKAIKRNNASF